jgi:hypothetical protein
MMALLRMLAMLAALAEAQYAPIQVICGTVIRAAFFGQIHLGLTVGPRRDQVAAGA